jgi:hypothetical protein
VTDRNASAAHPTLQQACPLCDGVVDMEELPGAEGRTVAFEILRNAGPGGPDAHGAYQLIDALVERGHRDLVTDLASPVPSVALLTLSGLPLRDRDRVIAGMEAVLSAVAPGTNAWPDGPSGLIRIDSLPLNFPAEAYAAR